MGKARHSQTTLAVPSPSPPGGSDGENLGGFVLGIRTPPATRSRAFFEGIGRRFLDTSRLFGPYIDLLEDQDFALRKDPKAYQRMMRDGQVRAAVRVRQLATSARRIEWVPSKDTPQAKHYAELIANLWGRLRSPNEVLLNVLDAVIHGSSFQECVWQVGEDLLAYIERMVPLHKDRFVFSLDGELAVRTPYDVFYGESVPPYTVVHHKYDPEPASWSDPEAESKVYFGQGEFDRIWPWWNWKQIILQLALRFTETLSYPNRVGRYPFRNTEAKSAVQSLMKDMENFSMATWPSDDGFDIDYLQAPTSGHQVITEMISYIDGQITKVLLGSTLILDHGERGSYALGTEQSRHTFGAIAEHDARSLCQTLESQPGRWLMEMNHWDAKMTPHATVAQGRATSLEDTVDVILSLIDRGYPVSLETVADITGIRAARPGETLLTLPAMPGFPEGMSHGEGSPFEGEDNLEGIEDKSEEIEWKHSLSQHKGPPRSFLRDESGKFAPRGLGVVRAPHPKGESRSAKPSGTTAPPGKKSSKEQEPHYTYRPQGGGGGGGASSGGGSGKKLSGGNGTQAPVAPQFLLSKEVSPVVRNGKQGLRIKGTTTAFEGTRIEWEALPDKLFVIGFYSGEFPSLVCHPTLPSDRVIEREDVPKDALIRKDAEGNVVVHARVPIH